MGLITDAVSNWCALRSNTYTELLLDVNIFYERSDTFMPHPSVSQQSSIATLCLSGVWHVPALSKLVQLNMSTLFYLHKIRSVLPGNIFSLLTSFSVGILQSTGMLMS